MSSQSTSESRRGDSSSGLVGTWWNIMKDFNINKVGIVTRHLDNADKVGDYLLYDPREHGHAFVSPQIRSYFPDLTEEQFERVSLHMDDGSVKFNIQTGLYEIYCNNFVYNNEQVKEMIIDKFKLRDQAYIWVNTQAHIFE